MGGLAGFRAQQGTDVGLPSPHGLRFFQCAPAADDAQPDAALVVLGGEDLDLPHLPGGGGVGAAAGADVGSGDGHDPHLPGDLLFAPIGQRGKLFGRGIGDDHRHILPDDPVGGKFRLPQPLGGDGNAGVHPDGLGADVEADVLRAEHRMQDAGEDVLAGVLLHLVEPRFPVDRAGHGRADRGSFGQGVYGVPEDAVVLVDVQNVQHGAVRKGQGAPIGRLAAAFGVKYRAIQRDPAAAGPGIRLHGEEDAVGFGAECIRFVIFLGGLHGGTSLIALSVSLRSPALPKGEPLADRASLSVYRRRAGLVFKLSSQ